MADDWFKLNMDIFGNRKIKYLRRLPGGNSIALFWIALLAEARRCNSDGKVFLTERIPYTPKMLAEEFDFEESVVGMALDAFDDLDMISICDGFITITGWEDHQNAEGLAKIREQNRSRQARFKAKKKLSGNVTDNVTVTEGNAIEEDKDKEEDKDIDIEKGDITDSSESVKPPSYQQIIDLYHSICTSFPRIRSLSEARKKAIKARLNTYTLEDFKTLFENAEASSFLKGKNERNWTATFDWLIKDGNMAKVLEGNYSDKPNRYGGGRKEKVPGWLGFKPGEAELDNIYAVMTEEEKAEAEQLRRELQESFGGK